MTAHDRTTQAKTSVRHVGWIFSSFVRSVSLLTAAAGSRCSSPCRHFRTRLYFSLSKAVLLWANHLYHFLVFSWFVPWYLFWSTFTSRGIWRYDSLARGSMEPLLSVTLGDTWVEVPAATVSSPLRFHLHAVGIHAKLRRRRLHHRCAVRIWIAMMIYISGCALSLRLCASLWSNPRSLEVNARERKGRCRPAGSVAASSLPKPLRAAAGPQGSTRPSFIL